MFPYVPFGVLQSLMKSFVVIVEVQTVSPLEQRAPEMEGQAVARAVKIPSVQKAIRARRLSRRQNRLRRLLYVSAT